ncbi:MAG: AbrB/MazE/SpoVT family DNA-binding domain-containing protein [Roseiarcus sp.]
MAVTRPFRSGNSQAVRIPADLAYEDYDIELTVTRQGDEIVIRPARPTLRELAAKLRELPKPKDVETREPIELPERE